MKVFISKYALTKGIFEVEVEPKSNNSVMTMGGWGTYYHRGEWHRTRKEAMIRAESMRQTEIAAVERKLARLKELKFQ